MWEYMEMARIGLCIRVGELYLGLELNARVLPYMHAYTHTHTHTHTHTQAVI